MESQGRAREPTSTLLLSWLKLFLVVVVGFEALYLVLANLMLWVGLRPLLRWVAPGHLSLDYASAYSLLPGDVSFRDLHLVAQDSTLEWRVTLEQGKVHMELGELFSRRVHMTHVRGSGLSLRFRQKLTPEEADRPQARALPPIEGYPDPPILPADAPEPPPSDADYHSYSAELDDIDTELKELWIHHYRFTGAARVEGSFLIQPLRAVRINADRLTVREGEVTLGEHRVGSALSGTLECTIDTFDPRELTFPTFIRRMRGKMDLYAETPGAEFVSFYLPDWAWSLTDGSGATKLRGTIDGGVLGEGSEVVTATDHIVLEGPERVITAGAEVVARVERVADAPASLRVTARVPEVRLSRTRGNVAPLVADRVFIEARTRTADLTDLGLTGVVVDVPTARAGDLRIFPDPSSDVSLLGGFAELAAHVELDGEGKGGGLVRANAERARLRASDISMAANLRVAAEIRGLDVLSRTARLPSATITLKDFVLAQPGGAGAPISGEVKITEGRIDRSGFEGALKGEGSDVAALFDFAGVSGPLRWAPDLLNMHAFSSDGTLRGRGGSFDLDLMGMKSGAVEGRGHLTVRGGHPSFALLLRAGPISAGVSLGRGGSPITPLAGDDWFAGELRAMGAVPARIEAKR